MRNLKINKRKIYLLNFKSIEDAEDSQHNLTGDKIVKYYPKQAFRTHISGARGSSQSEIFGTEILYDKTFVLTTDEFKELGITENSVFFVDIQPTYKDGNPLYDYRVERIAETINEVVIAITKVRR